MEKMISLATHEFSERLGPKSLIPEFQHAINNQSFAKTFVQLFIHVTWQFLKRKSIEDFH